MADAPAVVMDEDAAEVCDASLGAIAAASGNKKGDPPSPAQSSHSNSSESDTDPDLAPETAVAEWLRARLDRELARVREVGQRCIGVPLRNCALVVEDVDDEPSKAKGDKNGKLSKSQMKRLKEKKAKAALNGANVPKGGAGDPSSVAAADAEQSSASSTNKVSATIHRIEVNTAFDFDAVKQLMYSDPEPLPASVKAGYCYRTVVLMVDDSGTAPPMLVPYIYEDRGPALAFSHWRIVNNKLKETNIVVDGVDTV